DISQVASQFSNSVPPAPARYDIAPDPPDGFIDVTGDITTMAGLFSQSCAGGTPTPPPTAAGSALDFDGSNDYVTFGPAAAPGKTTFTGRKALKRRGTG